MEKLKPPRPLWPLTSHCLFRWKPAGPPSLNSPQVTSGHIRACVGRVECTSVQGGRAMGVCSLKSYQVWKHWYLWKSFILHSEHNKKGGKSLHSLKFCCVRFHGSNLNGFSESLKGSLRSFLFLIILKVYIILISLFFFLLDLESLGRKPYTWWIYFFLA